MRLAILFISVLFSGLFHNHGTLALSSSNLGKNALSGDWSAAKLALRDPHCCVVSVSGLDHHLKVLQDNFVDDGPFDLDLRTRIRTSDPSFLGRDCRQLRQSVCQNNQHEQDDDNACAAALEELALGVASLIDDTDGPPSMDVHMRVVCASDYRANDPMFHTDKAPLRGYVTLKGVGTQFMTRTCSPWEYMTLRTFGMPGANREPCRSVRDAPELEFIVMKGDYYPQQQQQTNDADPQSPLSSMLSGSKLWQRTFACVHRSPPGATFGGRRVIISLDLADGDDDREWYQAGKKREWRSGMTQRKSHLVA
ncbi:expressed unknown protein [Seminavis robusta]|uniref:Uncharacterized protein n=1 Tax=Seminavis robusta TaxID=568900 RepID=A0A9N8EB21_9STRA|nr:expressed unknown protein [Seminavis robusta]|eukprot:Sro748_g196660.1 n/a (309) ;mRNA; r:17067-17993